MIVRNMKNTHQFNSNIRCIEILMLEQTPAGIAGLIVTLDVLKYILGI